MPAGIPDSKRPFLFLFTLFPKELAQRKVKNQLRLQEPAFFSLRMPLVPDITLSRGVNGEIRMSDSCSLDLVMFGPLKLRG